MGLDWAKDRRKRQGAEALRDQFAAEHSGGETGQVDDLLGWVWLTCGCGHYGQIYNRPGRKFCCSKCNRLWEL